MVDTDHNMVEHITLFLDCGLMGSTKSEVKTSFIWITQGWNIPGFNHQFCIS